jgi:hypothetical protein
MTATVPTPIARHHLTAYVMAAVAAVTLVLALVIGIAVADSDSGTTFPRTSSGVQQELPTRFGEGRPSSPDAIEHQAVNDPARYGSPDAAEEWNR